MNKSNIQAPDHLDQVLVLDARTLASAACVEEGSFDDVDFSSSSHSHYSQPFIIITIVRSIHWLLIGLPLTIVDVF